MAMLRADLAAAQGDTPAQARLLHEAEEIQRAPARSAFESWRQRRSATKSDEGHLLAAAHLTIVVTPQGLEQGFSTYTKGHRV
jgi:hypothetical protein